MKHRKLIEQQNRALQEKAVSRPMPDDKLGMGNLMATLISMKITILLLQADFEERKERSSDE